VKRKKKRVEENFSTAIFRSVKSVISMHALDAGYYVCHGRSLKLSEVEVDNADQQRAIYKNASNIFDQHQPSARASYRWDRQQVGGEGREQQT